MESSPRPVILIIADISGYTRFMIANKATLAHAQLAITELIQALIKQVEIPLEIAKLEGDAVFLYAVKNQDQAAWEQVRQSIGQKMIGFFQAFSDKLTELIHSNLCNCDFCVHLDQLRLKIIAHSGQAVFYRVGRFDELAGIDVILIHRLLKNSLKSHQYILMTDPAYRDIRFPHEIEVTPGQENYDEIGQVKTWVYYPPLPEPALVHLEPINKSLSLPQQVKIHLRKASQTIGIILRLKQVATLSPEQ